MTSTPADLRAQAAESDRRAAESFDRCDTDGFVSQWANGITSRQLRLQADILEAGGVAEFPALFDLDGNLVAAKLVDGRYGQSWCLLATDDADSFAIGWFSPSHARKGERRLRTDRAKGFTEGTVKAPAKAGIAASGTGLAGAVTAHVTVYRADGGFSRDAEIVATVAGYDTDY